MGLFGKKEICCICGENEGKYKSLDGMVCQECYRKCGRFAIAGESYMLKNYNRADIVKFINKNAKNNELLSNFTSTRKIENRIEFDDNNKLWFIHDTINGLKFEPIIRRYADIKSYEVIEDGESVIQGTIGKAIAGGVLFGGVGAALGAVGGSRKIKKITNSLQIRIFLNDSTDPEIIIKLISSPVKSDSFSCKKEYENVQKIVDVLSSLDVPEKGDNTSNNNSSSNADELLKYKQLLDCGAITQEEFDAKKQQLLGL